MSTDLKTWLSSLILLVTVTAVHAQTRLAEVHTSAGTDSVTVLDSASAKRSFFKKFLDYFNDANKEKKNKKFDFSIIGGPHYSSDTKLGLGLVAAGLLSYRPERYDSAAFQCFIVRRCFYGRLLICWEYAGRICFLVTNIALNYNLYFYPFRVYIGGKRV